MWGSGHDRTAEETEHGLYRRQISIPQNTRMTYVMGVDGGASKTLAVLADQTGEIRGIGRGGNGNHQAPAGVAGAMQEIRTALEGALGTAGVQAEEVEATYFCLAGADLSEDFEFLRPKLADLGVGKTIGLHNDSIAALRSGTDNPNAVTVIVGSGTNAAGRNAGGDEVRLAALGWYSGDQGGGGDLGRRAVWHVARAQDGRGPRTALEGSVLRALGVPDADAMIRRFYLEGIADGKIRSLAPLVFRAANEGDAVARELIIGQGKEVAVTATALLRQLDILDAIADVVLGGSIFKGEGSLLLDTIRQELEVNAPLARIIRPEVEPVIGALFCAMDTLGIPVNEKVRSRVKQSFEQLIHQPEGVGT